MRPIQLFLCLCAVLLLLLTLMSSSSSSSRALSSSPFAHRPERQIRQARNNANAPYCSPCRQANPPLRDIRNASTLQLGDLEEQRAAQWLQETPSRRRRRLPANPTGGSDENRTPSPTPTARRPVPRPLFAGVGTPPTTQPLQLPPSKRQAAQRARQARDREERERRSSEQRVPEQQGHGQLLTPPATRPLQCESFFCRGSLCFLI
ncbi:hypothetical protein B0H14DRAFT_2584556 [Mycena olivaceomarginata]|nr:hypothetical protein B0H14DRAFT_2584556 [Mycena olivaceomarginata]